MTTCQRCGSLIQWSDLSTAFVCPVHSTDWTSPVKTDREGGDE